MRGPKRPRPYIPGWGEMSRGKVVIQTVKSGRKKILETI